MTENTMIAESLRPLAVPLSKLKPMPGNPRRGDVEAVARSYERFGQRKPIVARRDGTVIAGNHQLKAAAKLGWKSIAVVYVDDDDTTAKAYAIADNRTADLGAYDDAALLALLRDVAATENGLDGVGYSQADVDAMLSDVPDFQPSQDPQPRLDQRSPNVCPQCSYTWRVGASGEIEPA